MLLFLATLPLPPPLLKIPVEVEGQGKPGESHRLGCAQAEPLPSVPQKHSDPLSPPHCLTGQPSPPVVGGKWQLLEEGPRLLSSCSSLPLSLQVPKDRA